MRTQYVILVALMLFASISFIAAESNISVNSTADVAANISGDTSDDEVHSALRYGWEKFKLNFIRNETIKAERELRLARWKLAEAKFKANNGNFDGAEQALEDHDRLIEDVQSRIERMQNGSLTPGLDRALEVHGERLSSLKLLLESSNLTEQQRTKIEVRISKLEDNTEHLSELRIRIEDRREDKLQRRENRTERIDERGDRVRERIRDRENSSDENDSDDNSSSDGSFEDDSDDDSDDNSTDDSNEDSEDDSDEDDESGSVNVGVNASGSVNL